MDGIKTLFFYAWVVLIAGCAQIEEVCISKLFISFEVDSLKTYPAENIPKNTFMFSPVDPYDKIWISNASTPYELDLKTGVWTSLTARFGNIAVNQLREDRIWKDNFTGETYIGCFPDGFIRYYPDKDTFDILKITNLSAFYPEREIIVLGTYNGLFLLNKKDRKIRIAENFPIEIGVNSIQGSGADTLMINHLYYYHIPTKAFGRSVAENPLPGDKTKDDDLPAEVNHILPGLDFCLQDYNRDSITWYSGRGELFFTKNKSDYYKFILFPEEYTRHLIADRDYLYVLFNRKFIIFNKEYIYKHSIPYNVPNYQQMSRALNQKLENLNKDTLLFERHLAKSVELYKDSRYSDYPALRFKLENLPNNFDYYSFNKKIKNAKVILENDSIPDAFKFYILKGLVRKHTISLELDSALVFLNIINNRFPDFRDFCVDHSLQFIAQINNSIDSIKKEDMPPDKRLFLEAKAREKLVSGSYWFGELHRDYSIVVAMYQELLTLYPKSDYADDAEFWLINYLNPGDEQGGFPLEKIPAIQKFADRYPNSALTPKLLIKIAQSYEIGEPADIDAQIKNLEKGIDILNAVINVYNLDSSECLSVKKNIFEMKMLKNEIIFNLILEPVKSVYGPGEDIEMEISLSINCSTPQKIRLYKKDLYFTFSIYPENKCKFVPLAVSDTTTDVFQIISGKPLRQKVTINRQARYWEGGKPGKFCPEEEGLYYITCFSRENGLRSNQAKIYIKE